MLKSPYYRIDQGNNHLVINLTHMKLVEYNSKTSSLRVHCSGPGSRVFPVVADDAYQILDDLATSASKIDGHWIVVDCYCLNARDIETWMVMDKVLTVNLIFSSIIIDRNVDANVEILINGINYRKPVPYMTPFHRLR